MMRSDNCLAGGQSIRVALCQPCPKRQWAPGVTLMGDEGGRGLMLEMDVRVECRNAGHSLQWTSKEKAGVPWCCKGNVTNVGGLAIAPYQSVNNRNNTTGIIWLNFAVRRRLFSWSVD
jgi:hypothetical protein